jgi:hypothetical protein
MAVSYSPEFFWSEVWDEAYILALRWEIHRAEINLEIYDLGFLPCEGRNNRHQIRTVPRNRNHHLSFFSSTSTWMRRLGARINYLISRIVLSPLSLCHWSAHHCTNRFIILADPNNVFDFKDIFKVGLKILKKRCLFPNSIVVMIAFLALL